MILKLTLCLLTLTMLCTSGVPLKDPIAAAEEEHGKERRMAKMLKVVQVVQLQNGPVSGRLSVGTDRFGVLWLALATFTARDLDCIRTSWAASRLVVVEFDDQTQELVQAYFPTTEPIAYVSAVDENNDVVRVTALKRPTPLVLRKDHPQFNDLYLKLATVRAGMGRGEKAALAISPGGNTIMDVVVVTGAATSR